jgi:ferredoxin
MKASVDPERCQGHARCWQICPEVFTLDEDGYSRVQGEEVPPDLEGKAREAEANCPERAIALT